MGLFLMPPLEHGVGRSSKVQAQGWRPEPQPLLCMQCLHGACCVCINSKSNIEACGRCHPDWAVVERCLVWKY